MSFSEARPDRVNEENMEEINGELFDQVPIDSPTFDKGVLLIAARNCWSLNLCDGKMQFIKVILLN